ncbi:MAG: outer membrane protein assembly factor BamD [Alphaproteobacteria bacterium]|nr:outer membrane protein assembly factor BamD [Alphaproteobacteria bacterium]
MKKILLITLLCLTLAACSSDTVMPEKSVGTLYNEAMDYVEDESYAKAIKLFDEVERQHPYSPWAAKAQIMTAYLYYVQPKYTDAVLAINRFLSLHPGNKYAPYAYYLKGMCYYEQITDTSRSQMATKEAYDAFNRLIVLYPDSEYAKDAVAKMRLTLNHMAGKEMTIGRYYLKQGKYGAALNRFADVVRNYQNTEQVEEALYRLTETYLILGLSDEAKRSAAVLGYNYPASEWYKKAYNLMQEEKAK